MIRINDIMNQTNGGLSIFKHYIDEQFDLGRAIRSPLRPDKKPSFSVFKSDDGTYLFKDHGEYGKTGNAVQFVKELKHLGFADTLELIVKDFGLKNDHKSGEYVLNTDIPEYSLSIREFTDTDKGYWKKYGISLERLAEYGLKSIKEYSTTGVQNQPITIQAFEQLMFAYDHGSWAKIYRPNDKRYRFRYLGFKPTDYVFGYDKLPQTGSLVIITGGEKDVLSLVSRGYNAISLNSETAALSKTLTKELTSRFKKVVILYDKDKTGLIQSEKLASGHGLYRLVLPDIPKGGKDVSDYFMEGGTKEELDKLLDTCEYFEIESPKRKSRFISAEELLAMGEIEMSYLWKPFFPTVGTGVIAGMPDTGKSQFARNLCIAITSSETNFLGFEMNCRYNSAIYIATEDNEESTAFLINRQTKNNEAINYKSLQFLFGDSMETEEILKELEERLKVGHVDLVVVDSFGDIFLGGDSNNNIQMRKTVNNFNQLASKYKCFILFVHHINKAAYDKKPGQQNIQGGSGLTQKVRIAIQISPGEGEKRYFTVLKGNYCPKEYKEESLELIFNENSFLFSTEGKRVKNEELSTDKKKKVNLNHLEQTASEYFMDRPMSYGDFVQEYSISTTKSERTAKRVLNRLKENNLITVTPDGYVYNNTLSSENSN